MAFVEKAVKQIQQFSYGPLTSVCADAMRAGATSQALPSLRHWQLGEDAGLYLCVTVTPLSVSMRLGLLTKNA